MSVTISKNGWIIETTHTCHGLLEQGGVSGRHELVTNAQLLKLDITGAPNEMYNEHVTNEESVRYAIKQGLPTQVIRKGHLID